MYSFFQTPLKVSSIEKRFNSLKQRFQTDQLHNGSIHKLVSHIIFIISWVVCENLMNNLYTHIVSEQFYSLDRLVRWAVFVLSNSLPGIPIIFVQ